MNYSRTALKETARATLKVAHPRPQIVMLVYWVLTVVIGYLITLPTSFLRKLPELMAYAMQGEPDPVIIARIMTTGGMGSALTLFISILFMLYSMVMAFGFNRYSLSLYRKEPAGIGDLFGGFSSAGRVILLAVLIAVFTFLWTLCAGLILGLLVALLAAVMSVSSNFGVLIFVIFAGYIAMLAFLLNRVLRYSAAFYLLMDHPEYSAREALNASKVLMRGNLWKYFVLQISFIGWYLLQGLIIWIVMFVGIFVLMAGIGFSTLGDPQMMAAALMGGGFIVGFIAIFFLALLISQVIGLWLMAYVGCSDAGFYHTISGQALTPPAVGGPTAPYGDPAPAPFVPLFSSDFVPPTAAPVPTESAPEVPAEPAPTPEEPAPEEPKE